MQRASASSSTTATSRSPSSTTTSTTTARAEALKPEVLALVAPALGAYLGEVAIARFGGHWVIEGDDPADWRVELEPAPLAFYPVGMAAEALRGEEVDGYDASFATREDLMGPLPGGARGGAARRRGLLLLAHRPLETLTHALDILVELERKRREPRQTTSTTERTRLTARRRLEDDVAVRGGQLELRRRRRGSRRDSVVGEPTACASGKPFFTAPAGARALTRERRALAAPGARRPRAP